MKIDLTCPVEVCQSSLPTEEHPVCDLLLNNLTGRQINSVELNIRLMDKEGHELTHILHRCYSLNGAPYAVFPASVAVDPVENLHHTDISLEKVWFEDHDVWRRDKVPPIEYVPNNLPSGRNLEMLQYVAGENAVGFPEERENVWLCVCGRPNDKHVQFCSRCRQTKEQVFSLYNPETIRDVFARKEHQLDLQTRAVREDTSRLQQIREADFEKNQAKIRRRRRLIISLASLVLLTLVLIFAVIPGIRYMSALYNMDHGNAAEAEKTLLDLGSFPGAEAKLPEARLLRARQSLGSADAEALESAAAILRDESGSEEDLELAKQADFERADVMLAAGDPDGAKALYTALGDYPDCVSRIRECNYVKAEGYYSRALYPLAWEYYDLAGDYKDSVEKAAICIYLPAAEMMENGEYAAAIAEFSRIADYSDSAEQIRICNYLQALSYENEGNTAAAADAYAAAGNYSDADSRARSAYYIQATKAQDAGDYVTAAELYAKAQPLEGADEKYRECIYIVAAEALNAKNYEKARELFASLPADYSDASVKVYETWYRPGSTALKAKKWEDAVTNLVAAGNYKDAPTLLEKARYGWASALQKSKDYEAAIAQYEILVAYSDSEKQLTVTRYAYGQQLMQNGEYDKAIAQFELIESYKDSGARLKEAKYQSALAMLKDGDTASARVIFADLGKYSDAATQLKACDYTDALNYEEAGELETAVALYAAAGDYSNAADRSRALYWQLAQQAERAGRSLTAAGYYTAAGKYEDAAARAETLYDSYYGEIHGLIKTTVAEKNYAAAIALMDSIVMTDLPAKYADLSKLYSECCYQLGNTLLDDGKPYEALPYLRKAGNVHNTSSLLKKGCYTLLGSWQDNNGKVVAVFRENGTCTLDNLSFFFNVKGYDVSIGETATGLKVAYRMGDVSMNSLTLTDSQTGRVRRLTRAGGSDPVFSGTAEGPEENFVVEDEGV